MEGIKLIIPFNLSVVIIWLFKIIQFVLVKPFSFNRSSLGMKKIPLSAPLCPFRVLVGMDPHHHAQLLLCLPTPEGQDASPAGTAATWDQPDGLPGSLEFPDLSPTAQSEWVNLCVWLCFGTPNICFVGWESVASCFSFFKPFDIYCLERGNGCPAHKLGSQN